MVPRTQELLCGLLVRFFFEALHLVDRVFELLVERFALLNITVGRGWEGWRNTKCDQVTLARHFERLAQQIVEEVAIANEMVGWQDRHGGLGITLAQYHGGQAHDGRRS